VGLHLRVLPDQLAVCRLDPGSDLPGWFPSDGLRSISWTQEELAIVCAESAVPADVESEPGWRAFMVEGPLDFGLTGILLQLAEPLARAGISIFALSTFDTDYVMVKGSALEEAERALVESGHRIR